MHGRVVLEFAETPLKSFEDEADTIDFVDLAGVRLEVVLISYFLKEICG